MFAWDLKCEYCGKPVSVRLEASNPANVSDSDDEVLCLCESCWGEFKKDKRIIIQKDLWVLTDVAEEDEKNALYGACEVFKNIGSHVIL